MLKKPRILTFIFALLLIISVAAVSAFAAEDGEISVTASEIVDGKFTATVSISGNPGISGMSLRLGFDKKKMTPAAFDASKGIYPEALSNMTQSGADLSALDAVTYFFADSNDISANGELFRVTFKISEDAFGTAELALSHAEGGVTNSSFDQLSPKLSGCRVDISRAKHPAGIISLESEYLGLDFYRVNVGLYGNPGIAAMKFKLGLSDAIIVRSVDFGGIFDNVTSNATQPNAELAKLRSITYNYTNPEDRTDTGLLFSFTLRLVDGFGRINVSFEDGDIVNSKLEILSPHKSQLTFGTLDIATVSFDGNTALALASSLPADITYVKNSYITLPFCPEREDKAHFLGWSEDKNATSAQYKPGDKYLLTENKTLYAVWTVRTYTVTYNANSGSDAPSAQTKIHGEPITLSETVPTNKDHVFIGWSVLQGGSAVDYAPGDIYAENISVTLYAIWKPCTYEITFDANGGENAPAGIVKSHYISVILPAAIPTKTGFGFAGWAESPSGTVKYLPGSEYSANGNATLYAVWTEDKYDITFDANGGMGAPYALSVSKSLTATLPITVPEKAGCTFLGWAESKSAPVPDYKIGEVYSKKTSVTLYAIWETAKYTVAFDTNGGTGSFSALTFTHGNSAKLPSSKPEKTGFDFLGWAESPSAAEASYAPGGTYSSSASTTLYAVWSAHRYNVTFSANGGSGAPVDQEKLYGTDLRLSAAKPIREGYTFLGWAESADAKVPAYMAGGLYSADKSVTLYAIWTVTEYNVSYDVNGGTGAPPSDTKTHGAPLYITSYYPIRTGYVFLGWASDPSADVPEYKAGDAYVKNEDALLYAVWTVKEYTVSYDANGGSLAPSAQKKSSGVPLTLVNIKPTRADYVFIGWSLGSEDQEVAYNPGDTYTDDSDITLYAVWCEAALAAKLDLNIKSMGSGKVRVDLILSSNPGISSLAVRLRFDSAKVKAVDIERNEYNELQSALSGAYVNVSVTNVPDDISTIDLRWNNSTNKRTTGTIMSVTFEVLCEAGEKAEFSVELIKDVTNASFETVPTGVDRSYFTIPDFLPGDLNDDGEVNAKDAVLLAQILANWNISYNPDAADCNGDGDVNAKDAVLLAQYLANWNVTLG